MGKTGESIVINIARDFTEYPGPRYISQGDKSGEQFFIDWLKPKFNEAKMRNCKLVVDLDGTAGYASSFLDQAFGLLVEMFGKNNVLEIIEVISLIEPDWKDMIFNETIEEWATKKKKK